MKRISIIFLAAFCGDCHETSPENASHEVLAISTPCMTDEVYDMVKVCPVGMVLVEGEYCPNVIQSCVRWVDAKGNTIVAPVGDASGRCGEFSKPTRCASQTIHKKYCIDEYEFPNVKGLKPQSWMTWYDAKSGCEATGKRLCTKNEWTFACEGPEMHPYPYGDGYHRDKTSCNFDNEQTFDVHTDTEKKRLLDAFLHSSGDDKTCVSPFGVHDMPGNIDEWVVNESGQPYVSGLVGGHVFGVRNACRPMTSGHGPSFGWYETGTRCCVLP